MVEGISKSLPWTKTQGLTVSCETYNSSPQANQCESLPVVSVQLEVPKAWKALENSLPERFWNRSGPTRARHGKPGGTQGTSDRRARARAIAKRSS